MEFGARHCVPQSPNCSTCIFSERCDALKTGKVKELPVKLKKIKVKKLYFNYIVPLSLDGKTMIEQRTQKGIWQNLYQFPLVESETEVAIDALYDISEYKKLAQDLGLKDLSLYNEQSIIHKLSHRHIETRFWIAETNKLPETAILVSKVTQYAVPVLIEKFIKGFGPFKD
jgi:A/G-specific adenine glycosylase